jgi:Protein of unknown function (DUF2630)
MSSITPSGRTWSFRAIAASELARRSDIADEAIHNRIEELVAEEHELYERAEGGLTETERRRLQSINVSLDQCWDLLRQRRALREAGRDPGAARVRDPDVVEGYEQ